MQGEQPNSSTLTKGVDLYVQSFHPTSPPIQLQPFYTTPEDPAIFTSQAESIPISEAFHIGIPHDISQSHDIPQYTKGFGLLDSSSIRQNSKLQEIRNFSKLTRWITIVNCVLILNYIEANMPYLIFLMVFPALGYAGARIYSGLICVLYMMFVVVLIILDIVAMGLYPSSLVIVLSIFSILANIFIIRVFYRFYVLVKNLTTKEKTVLLKMSYIPPNQFKATEQNSIEV